MPGILGFQSFRYFTISEFANQNGVSANYPKISDVEVTIYTQKQTKLTKADVKNFNAQYPTLKIKYTKVFHDRFLILDRTTAYHVSASLKDAGKKCFGINLIQDAGIIKDFPILPNPPVPRCPPGSVTKSAVTTGGSQAC